MPIGWVAVRSQLGRDHHRQPADQVAQRPVGLAAGADHHRRPEVGQRRALGGEDPRGLVTAAQVLGLALVAEPAEVDDPLDAFALGHAGEVARAAAARARRTRRRRPSRGRGSRRPRCPAPAPSRLAASVTSPSWSSSPAASSESALGAVADQAADSAVAIRQRRGQPAADEAGRSGDEGALARSPKASPTGGLQAEPVPIHLLERSQRVEVPVEQAFAFYGDALNLEPLTPPWLHFEVTTPEPVTFEAGTLLDYRLQAARRPDPLAHPDRDLGTADALRRHPGQGALLALGAHPPLRAGRRRRDGHPRPRPLRDPLRPARRARPPALRPPRPRADLRLPPRRRRRAPRRQAPHLGQGLNSRCPSSPACARRGGRRPSSPASRRPSRCRRRGGRPARGSASA